MLKIINGIFGILNMLFCIINYFGEQNIPLMILEAMFAIIFFLVFLMIEEDEEDGYWE